MIQGDLEDIDSTEIVSKNRLEEIYKYLQKLINLVVIEKKLVICPKSMDEICFRLKQHCDPNIYVLAARARDEKGNSLLHVAQQHEDCNTIIFATSQKFLRMGPEVKNNAGHSYLHLAYRNKKFSFIERIILASGTFDLGINTKDVEDGNTLLHYAAKDPDRNNGDYIIGLLVEKAPVDACVKNNKGETPSTLSKEAAALISKIVSTMKEIDKEDDEEIPNSQASTDGEDNQITNIKNHQTPSAKLVGPSISQALRLRVPGESEIYNLTPESDLSKVFGW